MTTIYTNKPKNELPKRHKNDLYRTERTLINAALERFAPVYAESVLDIGAGDGRWGQLAAEHTGAKTVVGVELEFAYIPEGFTDWYSGVNFLDWSHAMGYEFIVSNPPYKYAEEFIRKAWELLLPMGVMLMLLPLQFQASKERYDGLWNELPPKVVAVCSRRPSFYGGKTNGTDYAIYQWVKDMYGNVYGTPRQWPTTLLYYERDDTNAHN